MYFILQMKGKVLIWKKFTFWNQIQIHILGKPSTYFAVVTATSEIEDYNPKNRRKSFCMLSARCL